MNDEIFAGRETADRLPQEGLAHRNRRPFLKRGALPSALVLTEELARKDVEIFADAVREVEKTI